MSNLCLTLSEHSLGHWEDSATLDPSSHVQRAEHLVVCFDAVKSIFVTYFSLERHPLASYQFISLPILTYLTHSLVALFRLSTFHCADIAWDRAQVLRELDLGEVMRLWAQRWQEAPAAAGIDTKMQSFQDQDPWTHARRKIEVIAKWWEDMLPRISAEAGRSSAETISVGSGNDIRFDNDMLAGLDLSCLNMDLFSDLGLETLVYS